MTKYVKTKFHSSRFMGKITIFSKIDFDDMEVAKIVIYPDDSYRRYDIEGLKQDKLGGLSDQIWGEVRDRPEFGIESCQISQSEFQEIWSSYS